MELLFLSFLPGVDAPHVHVRALKIGCFYSTYVMLVQEPFGGR